MIRRTLETLAAGCAVYLLVAACSGSSAPRSQPAASTAGQASDGGHDGQGGVSGGGEPGAAGDLGMAGLLDPVAGASAQAGGASGACDCPEPYVPPEPVVVEAECEEADGTPTRYAFAEFPGLTEDELAGVVALARFDPVGAESYPGSWPATFGTLKATVFVKDGMVAANCGSTQFAADSVTFVLP